MYRERPDLLELAKEVIFSHPEFDGLEDCRIRLLGCDKAKKNKNKIVYADTTKVNDMMKAISGADFVITFYEPNCDGLTDSSMHLLMYHELRHVGFNDGECSIIPHDVEDFRSIIEQNGIDWIRG